MKGCLEGVIATMVRKYGKKRVIDAVEAIEIENPKWCSMCRKTKPITAFRGRMCYCADCVSLYQKEYRRM